MEAEFRVGLGCGVLGARGGACAEERSAGCGVDAVVGDVLAGVALAVMERRRDESGLQEVCR